MMKPLLAWADREVSTIHLLSEAIQPVYEGHPINTIDAVSTALKNFQNHARLPINEHVLMPFMAHLMARGEFWDGAVFDKSRTYNKAMDNVYNGHVPKKVGLSKKSEPMDSARRALMVEALRACIQNAGDGAAHFFNEVNFLLNDPKSSDKEKSHMLALLSYMGAIWGRFYEQESTLYVPQDFDEAKIRYFLQAENVREAAHIQPFTHIQKSQNPMSELCNYPTVTSFPELIETLKTIQGALKFDWKDALICFDFDDTLAQSGWKKVNGQDVVTKVAIDKPNLKKVFPFLTESNTNFLILSARPYDAKQMATIYDALKGIWPNAEKNEDASVDLGYGMTYHIAHGIPVIFANLDHDQYSNNKGIALLNYVAKNAYIVPKTVIMVDDNRDVLVNMHRALLCHPSIRFIGIHIKHKKPVILGPGLKKAPTYRKKRIPTEFVL